MDRLSKSSLTNLKKNELLELCMQLQDKYLEAVKEVDKKQAEVSPETLECRAYGLSRDASGNFILSTLAYDVDKKAVCYLESVDFGNRFELAHQELDIKTTDHALFGRK